MNITEALMRFVSPEPNTGCWLWTGALARANYGACNLRKYGEQYAHRAVWRATHGPVPDGLCVLHRCDNTLCCNPEHMLLGTQLENIADRQKKNRQAKGERNRARIPAFAVLGLRVMRHLGCLDTFKEARRLGVGEATVRHAAYGRTWRHLIGAPRC